MRKFLLLILAAFLSPVAAMAQDYNKSLTFVSRTSMTTSTDDIVGVSMDVVGQGSTPFTFADHSFSMGAWMRLQRPTFSVSSYQFGNSMLMAYRGLNHMNNNGCIGLVMDRNTGGLILKGFGWGGLNGQTVECTIPENEWTFIAFSLDDDNRIARVYVNDQMVGEFNMTQTQGAFGDEPAAFSFGGFGCNGALDDAFIFDTPLSLADVQLIYSGRQKEVAGLCGWYTFDEAVSGNHFANQTPGNDVEAVYYSYNGNSDQNGLINGSVSDGTPDLSTITAETARELPVVTFDFAVPSASDYQNIASLTFTADGNTLTAGETVALKSGTEVTINVTPASGYSVASIEIDGVAVENGGSFVIEKNLAAAQIVITLAHEAYSLTVENPAGLDYTLTLATGGDLNLDKVLEGAQLKLVVDVPMTHILKNVLLGEEPLAAVAGEYTFAMPAANTVLTIDAAEKQKYAVYVVPVEGGQISVAVNGTDLTVDDCLVAGQVVDVTATPADGYALGTVKVNGETLSGTQFEIGEADAYIHATFNPADQWNPSLTFINNSSTSATTEDRVDVDLEVTGMSSVSEMMNSSVTVGAWVRMTTRCYSGNVLFNYGGLNHNNGNGLFVVRTNSSGTLMLCGFGIRDNNRLNLGSDQTLNQVLPLNEWHYVAVAVDFENRELRTYYDGAPMKSFQLSVNSFGPSVDDTPLGFGFGQLCYNGSIDDIHILNRAITDEDAVKLYSDKAAEVEGLCGWYTFDEVKEGTTSSYANQVAEKSAYDAVYYELTGSAPSWAGGITNNTRTAGTPDMATINASTQRQHFEANLDAPRTVSVATNDATLGHAAIVVPAAESANLSTDAKEVILHAFPADNAAFVSWTNADNTVVSTDPIFLYTGAADATFTANFKDASSAIEGIGIDGENGPVEYFNLQGVRVSADNLTPGFYIVRQGSKTAKVLIRK